MSSYEISKVGSDLILKNKYGIYSKNELEYQILNGHLTVDELSSAYYLANYQMVHVFRSLGIIFRNSLHDTRILDSTISPETHQMLLGTLLGDAFMSEPKAYQAAHSVFQMDYLYHKAYHLKQFISSIGYRIQNYGESVFFWTYRHDLFKSYFDKFYSHGKTKKYLNSSSIYGLEPRGLAFWYMDDGKYCEYGAYLCVGNITLSEGTELIKSLKDIFGLEATFQKHDSKKGYYNIYIKAESRSHFFDLINPYIIPSMKYKLVGQPPPKIFSDDMLIKKHISFCSEIERPVHFSGYTSQEDFHNQLKLVADPKIKIIKKIQDNMRDKKQVSITSFRKLPTIDELHQMFIKNNWTDKMAADFTGYSRKRISLLRKTLGIASKKNR